MHPGQPEAITRSCGKHVSNWGSTSGSAHPAYVYVCMCACVHVCVCGVCKERVCTAMWMLCVDVIANLPRHESRDVLNATRAQQLPCEEGSGYNVWLSEDQIFGEWSHCGGSG